MSIKLKPWTWLSINRGYYMAARGDTKFLFECWKVFHKWTQRTSEPVFNTRREIVYLQVVMQCYIYFLNTNEIPKIINYFTLESLARKLGNICFKFLFSSPGPKKVALKQSSKILRENKNLTRLYTTFFGC